MGAYSHKYGTLNGLCRWSLVIRVRKLNESGSISGHYTGKTDVKLDSLSFLTLISKLEHFMVAHMGSPWTGGQCFVDDRSFQLWVVSPTACSLTSQVVPLKNETSTTHVYTLFFQPHHKKVRYTLHTSFFKSLISQKLKHNLKY